MNLEGKVALVTGASRGIGRAIAELLVERGAKVIGTATSEGGAAAISEYLGENGKGLALNVTDTDSIAATLKTINDEFGAIDILVNNAGITRDNLLMRMKDDEWNDIIDTNLTPIFRMSKAVLRGMMKKRQACGDRQRHPAVGLYVRDRDDGGLHLDGDECVSAGACANAGCRDAHDLDARRCRRDDLRFAQPGRG